MIVSKLISLLVSVVLISVASSLSPIVVMAADKKVKSYSLDSPEGMAIHRQIQQMQSNQQSIHQNEAPPVKRNQAKLKTSKQKQKQ